jgi:3-oxocholest-4-en-26-oate---CoA ligase
MSWNLADLFEAVTDTVPQAEALVCVDQRVGEAAEHRLTYAHLDARANRLAHVLAERGVGTGMRVGLQLANGNEYLEGMLACFKLRAVPVNVNYRYVAGELVDLYRSSRTTVVIHEPDLAPVVARIRSKLPALRATLARGDDYEAALAVAPETRPDVERSGDDHYVLYTGGTTGRPKAVLWRHEDIFHAAMGGGDPGGDRVRSIEELQAKAAGGHTRCLVASPLMHGTGHWMALSTLLDGGTVIVTRDRRLDPVGLWRVAASESASWVVIVGDAFARPLVQALDEDPTLPDRLLGVTVVLSGGSTLSPTVKADLVRVLPSAIVVDGFGASETGGQLRMVTASGGASPPTARFTPGESTTVVDDDLRPLRPGDGRTGWLATRGHIPLGYHGDPEATARTFPEVDGVRWAVPGDRATIEADGTVVVFGRGSVSINSGGEKVHPEEVEAVLKSHPSVFDAVVVGAPDHRWGEVVTAVVCPTRGHRPELDELAAHCRTWIAGYKVPRRLLLVDDVLRSPTGKPDYRWARAVATGAPADPGDERPVPGDEPGAPSPLVFPAAGEGGAAGGAATS